jgi:hypothetical protein
MDIPSNRSTSNEESESYTSQAESGFQHRSEYVHPSSSSKKTLKLRVSGSQRLVSCTGWNFGSAGSSKD